MRESITRLEVTAESLDSRSYGPADAKRMLYESRNIRRNERDAAARRFGSGSDHEPGTR